MKRKSGVLLLLGAFLLILALPVAAPAQCRMCWSSLAGSEEGRYLAQGFNRGILFLLSVPFGFVVLFSWKVSRAIRQPLPAPGSMEPPVSHTRTPADTSE